MLDQHPSSRGHNKHNNQYLNASQMINAAQKRYNRSGGGHPAQPYAAPRYEDPALQPMMAKDCTQIPIDDSQDTREGLGTSDNELQHDWGDNTTCVTGNTSEPSYSCEDLRSVGAIGKLKYTGGALKGHQLDSDAHQSGQSSVRMRCARYSWLVLCLTISCMAYLSPLIMLVLPKTLNHLLTLRANLTQPWHTSPCQADCQGQLISFSLRMVALLVAIYAMFLRRSVSDMPRLFVGRACVLALVVLLTVAYWLFYGVRVVQARVYDYAMIVTFALSMVDAMLVMHYLAVVCLELRALRPEYIVRVVRSPDGESHTYNLGALSVQGAATVILQKYYRDFAVYNPYLERLPVGNAKLRMKSSMGGSTTGSSTAGTGFKMYNIDGGPEGMTDVNTQTALMMAAARKRDSAHNERFYEELEWERRVRKRRARLITSTEDAFGHIKRLHSIQQKNENDNKIVPMTSSEAARAVFPALARPLQKYLRVTRQQPRHTAEQVVNSLSECLSSDVAPKTFLDRFFNPHEQFDVGLHFGVFWCSILYFVRCCWSNWLQKLPSTAKWSIACNQLVSRSLTPGCTFNLRCHSTGPDAAVQLMCTVSRLPFLNLTEHLLPDNRFVLRLNSETSV